MLDRRQFLASLAAGAAASGLRAQSVRGARKPNIIFILADDLGYGIPGCYGGQHVLTPNIDRLAAEGMKFTSTYAGSTVCAPSRCALMTGYHMGHATVRGNRKPEAGLAKRDITVAETLKRAGYATALFGKWGLGGPSTGSMPNDEGFDEFYGYLSQLHAHDFYPEHLWDNRDEVFLTGNLGGLETEYSHHFFTEKALDFLERHKDRPFFLYLPYTVPHANNELGRNKGDGMEVPSYGIYKDKDWPQPDKGFAAMVNLLDTDVGKVLSKVQQLGLDNHTIIFFTSDNGPHREGGHNPDLLDDNGPLRGIKRDLYEGGIRVPGIVRWPGRIKSGAVSDQPWAFWDFLPTAAELAGVPAPKGIDGLSIVPTLTGKGNQPRHKYFYWEFYEGGFSQAARMGDWKAVRMSDPSKSIELYNLKTDIGEQNAVAAQHPDIVRKMEEIFRNARTDSPLFLREPSRS